MANERPHDRFFKHSFGKSRHAEGVFRRLLPRGLVERVDWSTLELEPGSYVDEELTERHSDLLYRAELDGSTALLFLLFEHQSTVDPLMAFRVLIYIVRIWERWLADNHGATSLPAIVPVVMYHGAQPWSAAVELVDVIESGAAARRYLPRLRFALDDLARVSIRGLRSRRHLSPMAKVAQAALKELRSTRPATFIHEWARELVAVANTGERGVSDLTPLWHYVSDVCGRELTEEAAMAVEAELGEAGRDGFVSAADSYRAEGRAEGRTEGRAEGRVQEAVRAVLAVFEAREMALPDDVRARIVACADPDQLEQWLRRAIKADSADEIFAE